ncbi:MAG: transaldolase, partial [Calditrichota bacterium]
VFVYLHLQGDSTYDAQVEALRKAEQPVVEVVLDNLYDIAAEFFRWEVATAIAGAQLQINPFDQPNVESAKVLAREKIAAYQRDGKLPEREASLEEKNIKVFSNKSGDSLGAVLKGVLREAATDDTSRGYVAFHAYVPMEEGSIEALQGLRRIIQKKMKLATTVGFGPRFLHSTGQLHKGDAGNGIFIQITADMPQDVAIPDEPGSAASGISFGVLKTAQAQGDLQALEDAGRNVIRLHLSSAIDNDLRYIKETLRNQL